MRSTPNFQLSIETLERAMRPASEDRIDQALAALSVQVASRVADEATDELQIGVYSARLRLYPADVALQVLADWPRKSKWWPTWCELDAELSRLSHWRYQALAAVRFALVGEAERASEAKSEEVANGLRKLSRILRGAMPDAPP